MAALWKGSCVSNCEVLFLDGRLRKMALVKDFVKDMYNLGSMFQVWKSHEYASRIFIEGNSFELVVSVSDWIGNY